MANSYQNRQVRKTVKNIIFSFFLLFFIVLNNACNDPETEKEILPPGTIQNCETIFERDDPVHSFYESNPSYLDYPLGELTLDSTTFKKAGIDSLVFYSGNSILKNSPTLLSFILIRNNKIVSERYFNGSNKDQSNNIHSASKSILSALIGIAVHEGYIDSIQQSIIDYLTEYKPDDSDKKNITIEHLLNMTSGLGWHEDQTEYIIEKRDDWIKAILDLPLNHKPGETFNYSTGNTHLLSAILTKATGMSNCDFLYSYLMNDLNISVEHWGRDPMGYFSGGCNFYITPREMAVFGLLYMNDGFLYGQQIIPSEWIKSSFSVQSTYDDFYQYGYCWWITDICNYKTLKAWGYGGQYICIIPEFDILIVSTANTRDDYHELDIDGFIQQYVIQAIK